MVDLFVLQSVSYVAGALGVLLAAFNYMISTRNADKARQATLFMGLYKDMSTDEIPRIGQEVGDLQWTDFNDFRRKYDSSVNFENYVKRIRVWNWFNGLGVLVKKKLIDVDLVYETLGQYIIYQWSKWRDIFLEYKKLGEMAPDFMDGFEFLGGEMNRIRKEKGIKMETRSP